MRSRRIRTRPPRSLAYCLVAAVGLLVGWARPALPVQRLSPAEIERAVERVRPEALGRYRELLTLPNDAHRPADIDRLLGWLETEFRRLGFAVDRLPTPGSPLLLAERRAAAAKRTVLVYLQADGQPVDPAAWDQASPWLPVLKERVAGGEWREIPWTALESAGPPDPDWRIFARSASDSKGPIAQFLAALGAADEAGLEPDFHLKVLLDTEEELGSPHLPDAVRRFRDRLAADMLVIFDGPPHASGRPTLTFGARGIALATLTTYGPRTPQHSGHYGNWAPNPAFRLARLLSSMKDPSGRVTIDGWYDGIEVDRDVRLELEAVPDDPEALRRHLGIAEAERVAGSLQLALQHPSLNVRGMRSAWIGEEARTVVPATATAELDVRLVEESDPDRLYVLLRRHIEAAGFLVIDREPTEEERLRHPRIATLTWTVPYAAFRTEVDSAVGRWLTGALRKLHGEAPVRLRTSGGSIPISPFVRSLDVPAVAVATVNHDNNQHSPNENLRLGDFLGGIEIMLAILDEPIPAR